MAACGRKVFCKEMQHALRETPSKTDRRAGFVWYGWQVSSQAAVCRDDSDCKHKVSHVFHISGSLHLRVQKEARCQDTCGIHEKVLALLEPSSAREPCTAVCLLKNVAWSKQPCALTFKQLKPEDMGPSSLS
eukprot:CAMPEP_0172922918 /NCGR_PEP_ID=MMETSP1075-20121228/208762_1 /TAXON_ID=2916 /ORGANISM="Ceratium fusus, Strain PA161109" /LENGTH=131 /DNA_ID=CAMNT_0013783305 /DNA_START=11 /DNA_END=407 /DNA_ORIENTATION=-